MTSGARGTESSSPGGLGPEEHQGGLGAWSPRPQLGGPHGWLWGRGGASGVG